MNRTTNIPALSGTFQEAPSIESRLLALYRRYRNMYLFTFLCGMLAHLFVFTNVVQNNDNAYYITEGYGVGITSARWLLEIITDLFPLFWGGSQNNTSFNGVFALLILSACACIIARLFGMEQRLEGWLWGAVFVCFPTTTTTFFYIYAAPLYALMLLLSAWAIKLADERPRGWIAGVFIVAAVLGVYQPFLPLIASILVVLVIRSILDGKETVRELIVRSLRFVGLLAGSIVVYMVILKIYLAWSGAKLSTYRGVDRIGQFRGFKATYEIIKAEYKNFLLLPFQDYMGVTCTPAIRAALIVMIILTAVALIWVFVRRCDKPRKILLLLTVGVLPFTVNAILLMSPDADIYTMMEYGLATVFLVPLAVMARVRHLPEESLSGRLMHAYTSKGRTILAAAYVVLILNYAWVASVNYTSMYYTTQLSTSYATTLITQVKSTEGYDPSYPWAIIGKKIRDWRNFHNDWGASLGVMRLGGNMTRLLNCYSWYEFIAAHTGYHVGLADPFTMEDMANREEVQNMPVYPNDGSIRIIDGFVVIRAQ